ncbi:hypothetical protein [Mycobacterium sp. SMC-11]|uniref:hypothetical protein n=1 Tax=Mycobacterium sp. SMC-11 TaxID=3385969 RepID=UPI00390C98D3
MGRLIGDPAGPFADADVLAKDIYVMSIGFRRFRAHGDTICGSSHFRRVSAEVLPGHFFRFHFSPDAVGIRLWIIDYTVIERGQENSYSAPHVWPRCRRGEWWRICCGIDCRA